MLPPVSVPMAACAKPPATATPEPEDETPVHRSLAHGFFGGETVGWCSAYAPSVSLTLPSTTAPASSNRRTTVASSSGRQSFSTAVPHDVGRPLVASRSLSAIGAPCRMPSGAPEARFASNASACAKARSPSTET